MPGFTHRKQVCSFSVRADILLPGFLLRIRILIAHVTKEGLKNGRAYAKRWEAATLFMQAIIYQKKNHAGGCKYYFASILSLTSFLINNRMDLTTQNFQPAPRTQKPRKQVIRHRLYSETQDEFPILGTFVCNIKLRGFFCT